MKAVQNLVGERSRLKVHFNTQQKRSCCDFLLYRILQGNPRCANRCKREETNLQGSDRILIRSSSELNTVTLVAYRPQFTDAWPVWSLRKFASQKGNPIEQSPFYCFVRSDRARTKNKGRPLGSGSSLFLRACISRTDLLEFLSSSPVALR